jgi:WD40 repeat protein
LVSEVCVLPDGRLASGSLDDTIRLWDMKAGTESARLEGHSGQVKAPCCRTGGSSGSWDGTIRLWDVKAGTESARLEGHSGRVSALCVLPGGRLALGEDGNTIRLWDVKAGTGERPPGI